MKNNALNINKRKTKLPPFAESKMAILHYYGPHHLEGRHFIAKFKFNFPCSRKVNEEKL